MGQHYKNDDIKNDVTYVRDLETYGYNMTITTVYESSSASPYHILLRVWIPGVMDIEKALHLETDKETNPSEWEDLMDDMIHSKTHRMLGDMIYYLSAKLRGTLDGEEA